MADIINISAMTPGAPKKEEKKEPTVKPASKPIKQKEPAALTEDDIERGQFDDIMRQVYKDRGDTYKPKVPRVSEKEKALIPKAPHINAYRDKIDQGESSDPKVLAHREKVNKIHDIAKSHVMGGKGFGAIGFAKPDVPDDVKLKKIQKLYPDVKSGTDVHGKYLLIDNKKVRWGEYGDEKLPSFKALSGYDTNDPSMNPGKVRSFGKKYNVVLRNNWAHVMVADIKKKMLQQNPDAMNSADWKELGDWGNSLIMPGADATANPANPGFWESLTGDPKKEIKRLSKVLKEKYGLNFDDYNESTRDAYYNPTFTVKQPWGPYKVGKHYFSKPSPGVNEVGRQTKPFIAESIPWLLNPAQKVSILGKGFWKGLGALGLRGAGLATSVGAFEAGQQVVKSVKGIDNYDLGALLHLMGTAFAFEVALVGGGAAFTKAFEGFAQKMAGRQIRVFDTKTKQFHPDFQKILKEKQIDGTELGKLFMEELKANKYRKLPKNVVKKATEDIQKGIKPDIEKIASSKKILHNHINKESRPNDLLANRLRKEGIDPEDISRTMWKEMKDEGVGKLTLDQAVTAIKLRKQGMKGSTGTIVRDSAIQQQEQILLHKAAGKEVNPEIVQGANNLRKLYQGDMDQFIEKMNEVVNYRSSVVKDLRAKYGTGKTADSQIIQEVNNKVIDYLKKQKEAITKESNKMISSGIKSEGGKAPMPEDATRIMRKEIPQIREDLKTSASDDARVVNALLDRIEKRLYKKIDRKSTGIAKKVKASKVTKGGDQYQDLPLTVQDMAWLKNEINAVWKKHENNGAVKTQLKKLHKAVEKMIDAGMVAKKAKIKTEPGAGSFKDVNKVAKGEKKTVETTPRKKPDDELFLDSQGRESLGKIQAGYKKAREKYEQYGEKGLKRDIVTARSKEKETVDPNFLHEKMTSKTVQATELKSLRDELLKTEEGKKLWDDMGAILLFDAITQSELRQGVHSVGTPFSKFFSTLNKQGKLKIIYPDPKVQNALRNLDDVVTIIKPMEGAKNTSNTAPHVIGWLSGEVGIPTRIIRSLPIFRLFRDFFTKRGQDAAMRRGSKWGARSVKGAIDYNRMYRKMQGRFPTDYENPYKDLSAYKAEDIARVIKERYSDRDAIKKIWPYNKGYGSKNDYERFISDMQKEWAEMALKVEKSPGSYITLTAAEKEVQDKINQTIRDAGIKPQGGHGKGVRIGGKEGPKPPSGGTPKPPPKTPPKAPSKTYEGPNFKPGDVAKVKKASKAKKAPDESKIQKAKEIYSDRKYDYAKLEQHLKTMSKDDVGRAYEDAFGGSAGSQTKGKMIDKLVDSLKDAGKQNIRRFDNKTNPLDALKSSKQPKTARDAKQKLKGIQKPEKKLSGKAKRREAEKQQQTSGRGYTTGSHSVPKTMNVKPGITGRPIPKGETPRGFDPPEVRAALRKARRKNTEQGLDSMQGTGWVARRLANGTMAIVKRGTNEIIKVTDDEIRNATVRNEVDRERDRRSRERRRELRNEPSQFKAQKAAAKKALMSGSGRDKWIKKLNQGMHKKNIGDWQVLADALAERGHKDASDYIRLRGELQKKDPTLHPGADPFRIIPDAIRSQIGAKAADEYDKLIQKGLSEIRKRTKPGTPGVEDVSALIKAVRGTHGNSQGKKTKEDYGKALVDLAEGKGTVKAPKSNFTQKALPQKSNMKAPKMKKPGSGGTTDDWQVWADQLEQEGKKDAADLLRIAIKKGEAARDNRGLPRSLQRDWDRLNKKGNDAILDLKNRAKTRSASNNQPLPKSIKEEKELLKKKDPKTAALVEAVEDRAGPWDAGIKGRVKTKPQVKKQAKKVARAATKKSNYTSKIRKAFKQSNMTRPGMDSTPQDWAVWGDDLAQKGSTKAGERVQLALREAEAKLKGKQLPANEKARIIELDKEVNDFYDDLYDKMTLEEANTEPLYRRIVDRALKKKPQDFQDLDLARSSTGRIEIAVREEAKRKEEEAKKKQGKKSEFSQGRKPTRESKMISDSEVIQQLRQGITQKPENKKAWDLLADQLLDKGETEAGELIRLKNKSGVKGSLSLLAMQRSLRKQGEHKQAERLEHLIDKALLDDLNDNDSLLLAASRLTGLPRDRHRTDSDTGAYIRDVQRSMNTRRESLNKLLNKVNQFSTGKKINTKTMRHDSNEATLGPVTILSDKDSHINTTRQAARDSLVSKALNSNFGTKKKQGKKSDFRQGKINKILKQLGKSKMTEDQIDDLVTDVIQAHGSEDPEMIQAGEQALKILGDALQEVPGAELAGEMLQIVAIAGIPSSDDAEGQMLADTLEGVRQTLVNNGAEPHIIDRWREIQRGVRGVNNRRDPTYQAVDWIHQRGWPDQRPALMILALNTLNFSSGNKNLAKIMNSITDSEILQQIRNGITQKPENKKAWDLLADQLLDKGETEAGEFIRLKNQSGTTGSSGALKGLQALQAKGENAKADRLDELLVKAMNDDSGDSALAEAMLAMREQENVSIPRSGDDQGDRYQRSIARNTNREKNRSTKALLNRVNQSNYGARKKNLTKIKSDMRVRPGLKDAVKSLEEGLQPHNEGDWQVLADKLETEGRNDAADFIRLEIAMRREARRRQSRAVTPQDHVAAIPTPRILPEEQRRRLETVRDDLNEEMVGNRPNRTRRTSPMPGLDDDVSDLVKAWGRINRINRGTRREGRRELSDLIRPPNNFGASKKAPTSYKMTSEDMDDLMVRADQLREQAAKEKDPARKQDLEDAADYISMRLLVQREYPDHWLTGGQAVGILRSMGRKDLAERLGAMVSRGELGNVGEVLGDTIDDIMERNSRAFNERKLVAARTGSYADFDKKNSDKDKEISRRILGKANFSTNDKIKKMQQDRKGFGARKNLSPKNYNMDNQAMRDELAEAVQVARRPFDTDNTQTWEVLADELERRGHNDTANMIRIYVKSARINPSVSGRSPIGDVVDALRLNLSNDPILDLASEIQDRLIDDFDRQINRGGAPESELQQAYRLISGSSIVGNAEIWDRLLPIESE